MADLQPQDTLVPFVNGSNGTDLNVFKVFPVLWKLDSIFFDNGFVYTATANATNNVLVNFTTVLSSLILTTSRYIITGPTPITVTSVTWTPGTSVADITISGVFVSGIYQLTIATQTALDASNRTNIGSAFFSGFTGGAAPGDITPPTIYQLVPQTATQFKVIYSEPVVAAEALVIANYTTNNGLVILGITQLNGSEYLLSTNVQTPGTTYTVTVSNVHDLSGNLI